MFAQTGTQIYSINNGVVSNIEQFIEKQQISIDSLEYSLNNPILVSTYTSTYTIKTGRFSGWENEPGDFDVIEISKNGQQKFIYKSCDGIAKFNNSKNLYTSSFNRYSSNGYFIEVPMTTDSKALIFLGQHYGTDLARLIIFILTDSDVKLVYNKKMAITDINSTNGNFSMSLVSNIVEEGDGTESKHTIYQQNGVLYFGDN